MTLTKEQFTQLKSAYAYRLMDNMDSDDMERMVIEIIENNLKEYTEEELVEEINICYEDAEDMLQNVTA